MIKFRYVLFDLDGTLLDTSAGLLKSIDHTIKICRFPEIPEAVKRGFIGPPIQMSLKKTYGLTSPQADEAAEIFREVYRERFLFDAVVYEKIFELLELLRTTGLKTGVATYKRADYAERLLAHFGITPYCDCIAASDYENKRTKADMILQCLQSLGCPDPTQAVLVGDTIHDYLGAKAAGVHFIGVTYGFGDDYLKQCDPAYLYQVAHTVQALISIFRQQGEQGTVLGV